MKTVWILGAGFSRSLGAPLLSDLLTIPAARLVLSEYPAKFPEKDLALAVSHAYEHGSRRSRSLFEPHWDHAEEFIELLSLANRREGSVPAKRLFGYLERLIAETPSRVMSAARERLGAVIRNQDLKSLHHYALKLMAAECCAFVENARTLDEGWGPYVEWAVSRNHEDTILTFNYDRVPEILSAEQNAFWIPDPTEAEVASPILKPQVYKLHGSVTWEHNLHGVIRRATGRDAYLAAIDMKPSLSPIATPGPDKQELVDGLGPLKKLWDVAAMAIQEAERIIFIGYRIPKTDAYSRRWLLQHLRVSAVRNRKARTEMVMGGGVPLPITVHKPMEIETVLGDDVNTSDSRRLAALLGSCGAQAKPVPMFAEDYLVAYGRKWD